MLNAEQFSLLASKQYSSHKQKSAIVQCLNKLLFYDIICFCQQLAALCSNDATYKKVVWTHSCLFQICACFFRLNCMVPCGDNCVQKGNEQSFPACGFFNIMFPVMLIHTVTRMLIAVPVLW